ncbi:MAG TPA: hypothetical protein VJ179_00170, partial [Patescibacteria group bacterium]|nr:hypothetical protein [Patescibacteria group bacterium]
MNQTVWETFLIVLFLTRTIRVLWYVLFLWQLKEYRLDRMRIHLTTREGKKLLFGPVEITKNVLALVFLAFMLTDFSLGLLGVSLFYAVIILIEAVRFLFLILKGQFFIPIWTAKTVALFVCIFFS